MAELVTVEGEQYTKRSPWGVWGLTLITLSIYGLVWWYKINDEARRYLKDESIRPGIAVLALFPGGLIIVPALISAWRTAERINRMQEKAGIQPVVIPILGVVTYLILSLHTVYYQSELNKLWDSAVKTAAVPLESGGSAPPLSPPPPP